MNKIKCFLCIAVFLFVACSGESEGVLSDGETQYDDSNNGTDFPNSENPDNEQPDDSGTPDYDPAWARQDNDGDGIKNGAEGKEDTDGDGTPNYLDTDSDGDGISDETEAPNGAPVDTDNDSVPDFLDTDSDGDSIPDAVEGTDDTDGDGAPNYRDTDSDNDKIDDIIEAAGSPPKDSDEDGTPDYLDDDSDNDGIPDSYEGVEDPDKDGIPNFLDDDADADGIIDGDEWGSGDTPQDSDDDGTPNFLDDDSDNDGLRDGKELEVGSDPFNPDTDGDGTDDNTEYIFGSDPTDPNDNIPEDAFYVELPYQDPAITEQLEFSTDFQKADIMILVDLSGSMGGEHENLKQGIKNVIIDGVRNRIPDTAFGLVKFGTLDDDTYQLTQKMTTDAAIVKNAVSSISSCGGSIEYHCYALYATATTHAFTEDIEYDCGLFGCDDTKLVQNAANCPSGGIGRACFRDESLPIFIMASDENFDMDDADWDSGSEKRKSDVITALNDIRAKFIGIDSGSAMGDFNTIADGTDSVDSSGNNFNKTINADGSGMSNDIVDAVYALTQNIEIDVTTKQLHVPNDLGVADTSQFIKSITPGSFPAVNPGQNVTFDVTFQNDFYENTTRDTHVFEATINVLGNGAFLDSRNVFIIVPGESDDNNDD